MAIMGPNTHESQVHTGIPLPSRDRTRAPLDLSTPPTVLPVHTSYCVAWQEANCLVWSLRQISFHFYFLLLPTFVCLLSLAFSGRIIHSTYSTGLVMGASVRKVRGRREWQVLEPAPNCVVVFVIIFYS